MWPSSPPIRTPAHHQLDDHHTTYLHWSLHVCLLLFGLFSLCRAFTVSRILHATLFRLFWFSLLPFTTMPSPSLLQLSTAAAVRNMKCKYWQKCRRFPDVYAWHLHSLLLNRPGWHWQHSLLSCSSVSSQNRKPRETRESSSPSHLYLRTTVEQYDWDFILFRF